MIAYSGVRGAAWFHALAGDTVVPTNNLPSVLAADGQLRGEVARFLCVVPNPEARFPRARQGEVGLEEAYSLAWHVRDAIEHDKLGEKRPIIAIVDVKSQAYGRLEEIAGIFLAGAAAADAYVSARQAGHPVIALVVGHAFSGGFLTHGYQANRILAFDDPGTTVHAMRIDAAARITKCSVQSLEHPETSMVPLSYDIKDFAKLGVLHQLLHVDNPEQPSPETISYVRQQLIAAIEDARTGGVDLHSRLESPSALQLRRSSRLVRAMLEEQWKDRR